MDNGILLLNKEDNITSNFVINKIKRILNQKDITCKKIGHAGTLDPNAKGVLVVLINGATKLSDYLLAKDKEYIAEIEIGRSYDTLDIWGKLEEEKKLEKDDLDKIKANIDEVLNSFKGKLKQLPPMYSSLKINGRKLYEIARNNESVDISSKEREVEIFEIKRLNDPFLTSNHTIRFSISCKVSKGTYIRSLAKMIGERLGYPSCMSGLTRTKSGEFDIKDSYTINDIELGKYQLIKMIDCIKNMKILDADDKLYSDCINGRFIDNNILNLKDERIAIKYNDDLLAIYELDKNNNRYKAKTVWN